MNICGRCGDAYIPYVTKNRRYGIMANGIIFGVGYEKENGRRFYRRKDKYIPLCKKCLSEVEAFLEVFNDCKREVQKSERILHK